MLVLKSGASRALVSAALGRLLQTSGGIARLPNDTFALWNSREAKAARQLSVQKGRKSNGSGVIAQPRRPDEIRALNRDPFWHMKLAMEARK
jgi:hypothetical protein